MSHAEEIIDSVREQIAETPDRLADVRARRDIVLAIAGRFPGALRTYGSGSVATGLVNRPVSDGDGGVVLDLRSFPTLGPDGDDELRLDVVEQMQTFLGPELRKVYPKAVVKKMKRGILVEFHAPYPDGEDPTVDLVVALTRANGPGLWIPNLDANRWDPSDPEKHVELLNAGTRELRRSRAQAIRVMKAWNCEFSNPAVSSFNIAALGLEAITTALPLAEAVATLFEHAAAALSVSLTPDPAGVSVPIKLLVGKEIVIKRLTNAATNVRAAINTSDKDKATELLADVFWKYVQAPAGTHGALIANLRDGGSGAGLLGVGAAAKRPRAFGDDRG